MVSMFRGLKILSIAAAVVIVGYLLFEIVRPGNRVILGEADTAPERPARTLSLEERVKLAKERSENVKGLYVTAAVANDQGRPATALREKILSIADTTEINAVVIDVKETAGSEITLNLKPFLEELKAKNVWTIARIASFRDNSVVKDHPEWYLLRADGRVWRDNKGNAWLDPMSPGAREYLMKFSKEVVDLGFDELQYDYIRFPSDGDTKAIVYPAYQPDQMKKYEALKDFFTFLHREMKSYRPDLILSVDLFGQIAIESNDLGIGQRLVDIGSYFDYVSLMLYPSHFYSGFYVPADSVRGLAAVSLPYRAKVSIATVSAQPYEVIYRSLLRAEDVLSGSAATSTYATNSGETSSTTPVVDAKSHAKLRPWLQDFDLSADSSRGIYYDAKAVRAEIDAAEKADASGWLLWSPTNTYTETALKKK